MLGALFTEDGRRFHVQLLDDDGPGACSLAEDPWLDPEVPATQLWVRFEASRGPSTCPEGTYQVVGPCTSGALAVGEACASLRTFDAWGQVVRHVAPRGGFVEVDSLPGVDCALDIAVVLIDGSAVDASFLAEDPDLFNPAPFCVSL